MKTLFRWAVPAALLFSLTVFIGCAEDDDPTGPTPPTAFEQMAEAGDAYLTAGTKNITADALWTELNDGDATQPYVISVRSLRDDTVRGHIPGASHWEFTSLCDRTAELPANKKIVVYCYTGQTASFATSYLNMLGFDAYNLKWGFCSWTSDTAQTGANGGWYTLNPGGQATVTAPTAMTGEHAFPTVNVSATTVQGMITERIRAYFTAGWKFKNASDVYTTTEDWYLLCYWPEAPYNAGHINESVRFQPGSLGIAENLKFVPTDKPVIVYCYTGHTSMQVCAYLNMLGYDAYSMRYGMNAVTDNPAILGTNLWTDLTPAYPVETGSLPVY